ncbi:hypothetical protein [uncultured Anaerovibrio sp.]|uniref:hypothetical protein n=1 Tax=uncultured Anaerovibrio sp. TaxID=361586 RepID=UPI002635DF46|nr:hypothetical protein [uncultured Anaerovibrio sp.]
MDMPAAIIEAVSNIDWMQVSEVIEDYGPVIRVIQHTWSHQSLMEIMNGSISVPDSVINDALAHRIEQGDYNIRSARITSHETGKVDIEADTKSVGRIELSGTIEEMIHSREDSHITFKVKERALKDHGLASWFFSRMSLSMVQNIFGRIEVEDIPTTIHGNRVRVDLKPVLETTELATTELKGHRLLDLFDVESATPHEGYITVNTRVEVPEEIKEMALNVLR